MNSNAVTIWDSDWKRAALTWGPALVYMAIIYALSDQPQLPPPPVIGHYDKIQHFIAYFGLTLFVFRAAVMSPLSKRISPYIEAFFVAAIYGAFDEFHQSFVPGRSAEFADWVANVLGAIGALVMISILTKTRMIGGKRYGRQRRR